jgi:hypothetical protein
MSVVFLFHRDLRLVDHGGLEAVADFLQEYRRESPDKDSIVCIYTNTSVPQSLQIPPLYTIYDRFARGVGG